MSPRALVVVGAAWFLAAVALGVYLSQTSFAIGWIANGSVSRLASLAGIYLVFLLTALLLIGWIIPVGIGVYRLLKH